MLLNCFYTNTNTNLYVYLRCRVSISAYRMNAAHIHTANDLFDSSKNKNSQAYASNSSSNTYNTLNII